MSELTTKIQNVGIHACSDQTAITYIDAVNIRDMMKQVCIEAITNTDIGENPHGMMRFGVTQAIKAIEGVN